jgi:predicted nucleotidyltransferase
LSFEFSLKKKIVKEAANLLYLGIEKEYKQAKIKAAKTFGAKMLPSNLEIALELDKISEDREGKERKKNLIEMRKDALRVMKILGGFNPILTGSVWRGTINHNSDIDILVYHDNSLEILDILEKQGFLISHAKRVSVTKKGINKSSYHVYLKNENRRIIEITIRNLDQQFSVRKCEVFGDNIVGLKSKGLEKIIEENPTKKFIPS